VAATFLAVLVLPGVAAAQATSTARPAPDLVLLSGRAIVPRGLSAGEIVVLRGRAAVAGVATEDVVVVDGPIAVTGQVAGSVVSITGDVTLGPSAQVGGDVLAGGDVRAEAGATVGGVTRSHVRFTLRGQLGAIAALLPWLAMSVSTLLLGFLLLWVAPRASRGVAAAGAESPVASLLWGLGVWVLAPLVAVALLASVLGMPLGLVIMLALGLVGMLGEVAGAMALGRRLLGGRPALGFLLGWAFLRVVALVPVVSSVVFALAAVIGTGAAVVAARRGRRPRRGGKHRAARRSRAARPSDVVDLVEEEPSTGFA